MKKWIICILTILVMGITVIVYRGFTMSFEDYLDLAETFHERKAYDQEMFNLERALDDSLELNGPLSMQTADIYRRMGACGRSKDEIVENFDKAIRIYEMENRKDVAALYFEKGKALMEKKTGTVVSLVRESMEKAVELYEKAGFEYSDNYCESCVILAYLATDYDISWDYLQKAERNFENLSKENEWRIGSVIYRSMGMHRFNGEMYEEAVKYLDVVLTQAEGSEKKDVRRVEAEVRYISGGALVCLGKVEEGKERIEKSIRFYDTYKGTLPYRDAAIAHAFLALAYGNMEPPEKQKVLDEGEAALSYFKQQKTITSDDFQTMGYIKYYLSLAYEKAFPEKGDVDFERWFNEISRLNAAEYEFFY